MIDISRLIVIAITIEPITINGALVSRRIAIATDCWTWLVSYVIRVISDGVPSLSNSAWESSLMCKNKSRRSLVPTPWDAFDARYWHTSALQRPTVARITSIPPILQMYAVSPFRTPLSMIPAITSGTSNSKIASNSLQSGPMIHSFCSMQDIFVA